MKKILLVLSLLFCISTAFCQEEEEGTGRIRIGFAQFQNKASAVQSRDSEYREIQFNLEAFTDMLQTALVKTRRFEVIERSRLDEVLTEQGLGTEGIVNQKTASATGQIRGVDFILMGTVTKCGFTDKTVKVGKFEQKTSSLEISIDFRLTDTSTGRIVLSDFVNTKVDQVNTSGTSYTTSNSSQTQISDAMRDSSLQSAFLIANAIVPMQIDAIGKDGKVVKLNYGSGFVVPKDIYRIIPAASDEDGWDSGFEEIGKIEIQNVSDKYSVGKVVEIAKDEFGGEATISEGCRLERINGEELKEFKDKQTIKRKDDLGNRFGY
ncbi:CsgG/HfaB family protein [Treponema sp.]|uniref:CsgG/HfaB family protein n=1 Tax=Treponema sp. TaxID=166 RepID=UPI003F1001F4